MYTVRFTDSVKNNARKVNERLKKNTQRNSLFRLNRTENLLDDIAFLIYDNLKM